MNAIASLSPSITKMIRMDHSHVAVTSHQYTADASPQRKAAIAKTICLALEIHARLEEEIFYPAMREVCGADPVLDKSVPEHDRMRALIAELRGLEPTDLRHADAFAQLMREVLHHVADEETVLLPAAERKMTPERLRELGAAMTKRRLELAAPKVPQIAANSLRALPQGAVVAIGALMAAAFCLGRVGRRGRWA
jgi:hemerythrin superfamily protein